MGNVSTSLLGSGSPSDIEEAAKEVIRKAGRGGRLIVSAGRLISDLCPQDNMRALIRAARETRL